MMNIGSLYAVKKFYWLLFPTKEIADADDRPTIDVLLDATAAEVAAIWSRELKCEVTYFSPETLVVFLEEDGKYKNVLTSDGKIGWTWFGEAYNEFFEEVKTEQ